MKDQGARNEIKELKEQMEKLKRRPILDIKIGYCPNCKHDTPQKEERPPMGTIYLDDRRHCLVCGRLILCSQETVCKVVREKDKK
jgi:hypothetical protein